MAQATVELRHLLKSNFKLFDFEYTFDDKDFKKKLEQAVIDHYYFNEIGQETPDHFKHVFKTRWLRMIDYYNELHNTTLLSYNPLVNHSMKEAMEQLSQTSNEQDVKSDSTQKTIGSTNQTNESDSTSHTTGDSTSNTTNDTTNENHTFTDSTTKNSDYPQQAIAGGDFLAGESNTISDTNNDSTSKTTGKTTDNNESTSNDSSSSTSQLDNTTNVTAENTANTTGTGTTNTEFQRTIEGLTGTTYQELIMKQRETLIRTTNMVIEELKPCFMLVY